MNSNSPHLIPNVICSLADLKDLSLHDQGLFLLSRIPLLAPRGKTFWGVGLFRHERNRPDPNWLAPGIPKYEIRMTIIHLLCDPWREIVRNGYVAEAPPGNGWYEITDKGWAVLESHSVKVDDDYINQILP